MGSTTARRLMLALLPLLLAAATASGEEQNSDLPYHHLSLFAGLGIESKDEHNEEGFAIGAGDELQFHEKWGVGVGIEGPGTGNHSKLRCDLSCELPPHGELEAARRARVRVDA